MEGSEVEKKENGEGSEICIDLRGRRGATRIGQVSWQRQGSE